MDLLFALLAQSPAPLAAEADGTGFLPYARGSFMLDFVFVAMFAIVLVQAFSIYVVRYRRNYQLHNQLQLASGLVLLLAVGAFEIDIRVFTDWEALAQPSAYWDYQGLNIVWIVLAIHLCFAIPTPLLWIFVIYEGLRKFPRPAAPSPHSRRHRRWGWIAALCLLMTSVTGWGFYVVAFVL